MDFALHHSFFVLQVALRLAWHNDRFRVFVRSYKTPSSSRRFVALPPLISF